MPALLSSELKSDGAPVRLKLLGENLIAFRDTDGRVGILDHVCPHRCASLFFGRNEENGIRCVYHGWKFSAQGKCVDAFNLPDDRAQREKISIKAYAAAEHLGIVWVHMGPSSTPPALPNAPALKLNEEEVSVWVCQRQCNYLQAMEGDIDTSHLGFLHGGLAKSEDPAKRLGNGTTDCGVRVNRGSFTEGVCDANGSSPPPTYWRAASCPRRACAHK